MVAVIKRAEPHKTIWRIANDLRGSVGGWDFKSYVLGFLFYRLISENLIDYVNATERKAIIVEGGTPEEAAALGYATLGNEDAEAARDGTVKEKGLFIRPSSLFGNMRVQAASGENLNETSSYTSRFIENSAWGSDSESDLRSPFDDAGVNSTKLGNTVTQCNTKLVKIMDAIGDPSLEHGAAQIDAFGDVYEYLMIMYASGAGESGGEFYTLREVVEVLATLALDGCSDMTRMYDPCAGSGSLLLKFAEFLGPSSSRQYFGQEINLTTYNPCRINMFLHDVNFSNLDIALGDTLTEPARRGDQPFDVIVLNPPYSTKWVGKDDTVLTNDPRFTSAGALTPKSKADLALTMYMLHWLAEDGTAAIVEFPGVLYRGTTEGKIRRYLVKNNFVHAVVQLPPDLFFGTTVAICIIMLKKTRPDRSVLSMDAFVECMHEGNKNRLTAESQQRIPPLASGRWAVDHVAALVSINDIKDNDWNLSVSSYVESEDTREQVDAVKLDSRIAGTMEYQRYLRASIDAIATELEADR